MLLKEERQIKYLRIEIDSNIREAFAEVRTRLIIKTYLKHEKKLFRKDLLNTISRVNLEITIKEINN